jgi:hypothetical protein
LFLNLEFFCVCFLSCLFLFVHLSPLISLGFFVCLFCFVLIVLLLWVS